MPTNTRKYVLLDRDGTIIVNKHYQKDPSRTELLPNARAGLDKLRAAGFGLVMITNQSGIGRGLLTVEDLRLVNESVVAALGGGEDYFAGVYYCPHVDADDCRCRKPKPGLIEMASAALGFSPSACYVVGDRAIDVEAGRAVGAATILVLTGHGSKEENSASPDFVAANLLSAAEWIIERNLMECPHFPTMAHCVPLECRCRR